MNTTNTYGIGADGGLMTAQVTLPEVIVFGIALFVLIAGICSIVFILWGGLLLILSGGKDDKIKPAINTIRYAIIGIIITVLALVLFPVFANVLGIPEVGDLTNPQMIFNKMQEIGNKIFNGGNSVYRTGTSGTGINSSGSSGGSLRDLPNDLSEL